MRGGEPRFSGRGGRFQRREGKQPERVSPPSLVRLCLLSPHSESKCLPGIRASQRNQLPARQLFSPLARYSQFLSLAFACAAGGNFRFATKVTKDAPKKGKTTVRRGFLPFLWNLSHLSTVRDSPPSLKRRRLTDMLSQRGSRGLEI